MAKLKLIIIGASLQSHKIKFITMNNIIRIIKIAIIAFTIPLGAFTQDVSININMVPATIQVNEIGLLEVQICNNGLPDIDVLPGKLRPLISVPGESVAITGIESSTNDGWGIFTLIGENIRIENNIALPDFECHSIFVGIQGIAELEQRTITGTIAFDGAPTTDNDPNNDNSTTSVAVSGILPIELLRFDAIPGKHEVKLEWETATELNNSHFEVERSADGRNYQQIGTVGGHGTTSQVIAYEFTDGSPLSGKSFYRLKQVDFDGAYEYSPVEPVTFGGGSELKIFPNPASSGAEINIQGSKIRSVRVYNMVGQLIIDESYERPLDQVIISSGKLPQGMYITRINETSEKRLMIK